MGNDEYEVGNSMYEAGVGQVVCKIFYDCGR